MQFLCFLKVKFDDSSSNSSALASKTQTSGSDEVTPGASCVFKHDQVHRIDFDDCPSAVAFLESAMSRFVFVALVFILGTHRLTAGVPATDPADLNTKQIFTGGFPQGIYFRGEAFGPAHRDYNSYLSTVLPQAAVFQKFMTEELPMLKPEYAVWATKYVEEHPEKMMTLHLNLEARLITTDPAVHQRYFPGHWVYEPGSSLTSGIDANATELHVADVAPYKVTANRENKLKGLGHGLVQILCLVPVDEQGNRDWYRSEYVIIDKIDEASKTLTVKRAQLFSTALPHDAGHTLALPMASGVLGAMAFYNLSSDCPRDKNGHNAGDVFSAEIGEWFGPTGPLAHFNGIAGDVNYFTPTPNRAAKWDVNNDGKADAGIVDGVDVWRLGDYKFLQQVRAAIGENRLFTSDGELPNNQQAVGVLDGIESEGLVQPDDGFRGISRTINNHLYWSENTPRPHDFRYVVLKENAAVDEKRGGQLRRLAIGTACCLGAYVTAIPDGVMPPAFAAYGSLGTPAGPMVRPAQQSPDLLGGNGLSATINAKGCTVTKAGDHLEIAASGTGPMTLTLKDLAVPAGDLTIYLDLQALDPLEGFTTNDYVPRLVNVAFSQLPDYGESKQLDSYYTDLTGYFGTHKRSVVGFYLRRPNLPAQTIDVTFTLEGHGGVAIYGLNAHSAADTLVRAFTNGIVAVNPSLQPLTVSLQGVAGVSTPAKVDVPALDAVFLPQK